MSEDQQQAAIKEIGNISTLLREAIAKSIPVAPDSYLTIAIPGTVIDTTDAEQGGSFVYDPSKTVLAPTAVRQAEAKLVDNMLPLAKIMVSLDRYAPFFFLGLKRLNRSETRARVSLEAILALWICLCLERLRSAWGTN